jgi:hypothetical protein
MQYKTIVSPSIPVAMLEFQDALLAGWRIDVDNLPVSHIMYYEIQLVREDGEDVKEVFNTVHNPEDTITPPEITSARKAGRPPQNKGDK